MVVIRIHLLAKLLNISARKIYRRTIYKHHEYQFKHKNIRYIHIEYAKEIARYFSQELTEPIEAILEKLDNFKP